LTATPSNNFCRPDSLILRSIGGLILSALVSCAGESNDSARIAVGDGIYQVAPAKCQSTSELPAFPTPELRSALLEFDQPVARTMTVRGDQVTEVWKTNDCQLTMRRRVHTNTMSFFSLQQYREVTFTPETCSLSVTAGNETVPVAAGRSSAVININSATEDIPWRVGTSPEGWTLTSIGQEPVASLWQRFGCLRPDALVYTLQFIGP